MPYYIKRNNPIARSLPYFNSHQN